MRGDVGRNAGERRKHMEPPPEHGGTHAVSARRDKQRMHAVRAIETLCLHKELWPPLLNIAAGRLESAPIQGHDTLLVPLAPKSQRSLGPTNRLHVERRELRDSRAGGIEQLEHRRIAQPRRGRGVGGLEQRLDLPGRQHTGKIARQFG